MPDRKSGQGYYMISAVARRYDIHPQTLRLYEREGLLKPSRTEGKTRQYSDADLEQLESILTLTRELGVNLAGVEIILNMRRKMDRMQAEVNEFMAYARQELARGLGDWERRLGTALVRSSPADLVRVEDRTPPGGRLSFLLLPLFSSSSSLLSSPPPSPLLSPPSPFFFPPSPSASSPHRLGLYRDAEAQFKSALKQFATIDAYLFLCKVYVKLDQPMTALDYYKKVTLK